MKGQTREHGSEMTAFMAAVRCQGSGIVPVGARAPDGPLAPQGIRTAARRGMAHRILLGRALGAPAQRRRSDFVSTSKTKTPPAPDSPANYESALSELERLIAAIEAGRLPLDELLASYQRGAVLLAYCRDKLEKVEGQMKILDEGALKPWTPG